MMRLNFNSRTRSFSACLLALVAIFLLATTVSAEGTQDKYLAQPLAVSFGKGFLKTFVKNLLKDIDVGYASQTDWRFVDNNYTIQEFNSGCGCDCRKASVFDAKISKEGKKTVFATTWTNLVFIANVSDIYERTYIMQADIPKLSLTFSSSASQCFQYVNSVPFEDCVFIEKFDLGGPVDFYEHPASVLFPTPDMHGKTPEELQVVLNGILIQKFYNDFNDVYKKLTVGSLLDNRGSLFTKSKGKTSLHFQRIGAIMKGGRYTKVKAIVALFNAFSYSNEWTDGEELVQKAGFDLNSIGFLPVSSEAMSPHITKPVQYPSDIAKPLQDDDFFAQVAMHESLIQSLVSQLDINPKLSNFSDWQNSIVKQLDAKLPYRINPVRNPDKCNKRVKQYYDLFKNFDLSGVLKTDLLGKVMPSIQSKYGSGKALDLMMTINPNVFKEGIPKALPQGITIGKKGEVVIRLNLHVDLRLAGGGESVRHMYLPIEVALKAPEPIKFINHMQVVAQAELVSVGIKGLKVFSLNPPKLEKNEAMLIMGAVGVQLNPYVTKLKKKLARPKTFQIKSFLRHSCFYKFLVHERTPDGKIATKLKLTDGSITLNIYNQGKRSFDTCMRKGSLLWGLKRGGPHVIKYSRVAEAFDKFSIARQWDAIAQFNNAKRDKTPKTGAADGDKSGDDEDEFDDEEEPQDKQVETDDSDYHDDL